MRTSMDAGMWCFKWRLHLATVFEVDTILIEQDVRFGKVVNNVKEALKYWERVYVFALTKKHALECSNFA